MGHFLAAVTVTVGYSDTFADPRGCHCNRRPLYLVKAQNMSKITVDELSPVLHTKYTCYVIVPMLVKLDLNEG